MPIVVSNIRMGLDGNEREAAEKARKLLGLSAGQILSAHICKRSLDARKRGNPTFVVSVLLHLQEQEREAETVQAVSAPFVTYKEKVPLTFPQGNRELRHPIVIAGFGPAGIFAAHTLIKQGYPVLVAERGGEMGEREEAVGRFWKNGILDEATNVQFGEGGAGTFSDGKLTTRISDPACEYILNEFAAHGAPQEILYTAKPHIGTDRLREVIASLRREILSLGGEIRFHTRLDGIRLHNGRITSVQLNGEEYPAQAVVLAVGHSARDTFEMLASGNISLEPKPFSVGVRIEQLQSVIDTGLYGSLAGDPRLPRGEYQLSYREGERCVYTFCMCPGGYVVPAASQSGQVVTNGMSYHARDGQNANSALVVSVAPSDFGSGPLDGMYFQKELEQHAFHLAGNNHRAPAMTVGGFQFGEKQLRFASVRPTYELGVEGADFERLFPGYILSMLKKGLAVFQRKLPGFSSPDGILTGVETRTSSPVRILRDGDTLQSPAASGLYPCGEGAGYAGGIMSAAADGIRVARQIISEYRPG